MYHLSCDATLITSQTLDQPDSLIRPGLGKYREPRTSVDMISRSRVTSMQVFGHKGVQVKSLAYGINDVPISSNAAFNPLSVLIFSRNRLRSRLTAV